MIKKWLVHGTTVLWALTILVLTSIPRLQPPDLGIHFTDKLAHAGVYGIFAFFLIRSFRYSRRFQTRAAQATCVSAVLFAALDEWHQYYIPGRFAEVADFLADCLGIGLVLIVYFLWKRNQKKHNAKGHDV